ncbi:C-type lectin domain family 2 member B-like isoform X3 [Phalacrocorax aristotelis]|uniref:C-type lectin domain family 2 member B-like isoform X3 n=1 Tax=Phalacrocorax aristotelis TaxID=126867 RepID=UPI003F4BA74C
MEEVAMIGGHNSNENVEEPLSPQAGGASPHPEVPGDTCKRTPCRALGKPKGNPALPAALALACPDDWVEYQRVCYYLSPREGSWEQGQEKCSSLGASLAVLKRPWELEFLRRLKGNADYWLGLRRRGERLEWVDGSSLNETSVFPSCCRIPVRGQGECVYLNDHVFGSTSCSRQQRYLCSKPQAVM